MIQESAPVTSRWATSTTVCEARIIPMVDVRQPPIGYESCLSCYVACFDAGEFTDDKHYTVADIFKNGFSKERRS